MRGDKVRNDSVVMLDIGQIGHHAQVILYSVQCCLQCIGQTTKENVHKRGIIRKRAINVNSPVDETGNNGQSLSIDKVTPLQQYTDQHNRIKQ